MKKILLAISFIVTGITYSSAQEVFLDSISSGFHDVYSAMEGQFYYTYYKTEKQGSKMATLNLLSYTRELMLSKKAKLEIPKSSDVMSAAYSNGNYLLIIGDEDKRTITRLAIDADGKTIKKTVEENIPAAFFQPDNQPKIIPAMPEGFTIISPVAEGKKQGYKLEHFERSMESRWAKTYMPEKGKWFIKNAYPIMERIVLIRKESGTDNSTYTIHTIQGDQGETMMTTPMRDGKDIFTPTVYKTKDDFGVTAGIMYNETSSGKPTGIFAMVLGPAGDIQKSAKIPWSKLDESINGNLLTNISEGKAGLFVDDVLKVPGGYSIICEVFTRISTGKEDHFRAGNFVFLNINEEAELTKTYMQEKTPREAIVKGSLRDMDNIELAQILSANHFFAYKGGTHMKTPAIVFQTEDTSSNLQILPLQDSMRKASPALTINKLNVKNSGNYIIDNSSSNTDFIKSPYNNVFLGSKEMMVIYQYSKPKLVIWFHPNLLL
jgi:hypothetical protein